MIRTTFGRGMETQTVSFAGTRWRLGRKPDGGVFLGFGLTLPFGREVVFGFGLDAR